MMRIFVSRTGLHIYCNEIIIGPKHYFDADLLLKPIIKAESESNSELGLHVTPPPPPQYADADYNSPK